MAPYLVQSVSFLATMHQTDHLLGQMARYLLLFHLDSDSSYQMMYALSWLLLKRRWPLELQLERRIYASLSSPKDPVQAMQLLSLLNIESVSSQIQEYTLKQRLKDDISLSTITDQTPLYWKIDLCSRVLEKHPVDLDLKRKKRQRQMHHESILYSILMRHSDRLFGLLVLANIAKKYSLDHYEHCIKRLQELLDLADPQEMHLVQFILVSFAHREKQSISHRLQSSNETATQETLTKESSREEVDDNDSDITVDDRSEATVHTTKHIRTQSTSSHFQRLSESGLVTSESGLNRNSNSLQSRTEKPIDLGFLLNIGSVESLHVLEHALLLQLLDKPACKRILSHLLQRWKELYSIVYQNVIYRLLQQLKPLDLDQIRQLLERMFEDAHVDVLHLLEQLLGLSVTRIVPISKQTTWEYQYHLLRHQMEDYPLQWLHTDQKMNECLLTEHIAKYCLAFVEERLAVDQTQQVLLFSIQFVQILQKRFALNVNESALNTFPSDLDLMMDDIGCPALGIDILDAVDKILEIEALPAPHCTFYTILSDICYCGSIFDHPTADRIQELVQRLDQPMENQYLRARVQTALMHLLDLQEPIIYKLLAQKTHLFHVFQSIVSYLRAYELERNPQLHYFAISFLETFLDVDSKERKMLLGFFSDPDRHLTEEASLVLMRIVLKSSQDMSLVSGLLSNSKSDQMLSTLRQSMDLLNQQQIQSLLDHLLNELQDQTASVVCCSVYCMIMQQKPLLQPLAIDFLYKSSLLHSINPLQHIYQSLGYQSLDQIFVWHLSSKILKSPQIAQLFAFDASSELGFARMYVEHCLKNELDKMRKPGFQDLERRWKVSILHQALLQHRSLFQFKHLTRTEDPGVLAFHLWRQLQTGQQPVTRYERIYFLQVIGLFVDTFCTTIGSNSILMRLVCLYLQQTMTHHDLVSVCEQLLDRLVDKCTVLDDIGQHLLLQFPNHSRIRAKMTQTPQDYSQIQDPLVLKDLLTDAFENSVFCLGLCQHYTRLQDQEVSDVYHYFEQWYHQFPSQELKQLLVLLSIRQPNYIQKREGKLGYLRLLRQRMFFSSSLLCLETLGRLLLLPNTRDLCQMVFPGKILDALQIVESPPGLRQKSNTQLWSGLDWLSDFILWLFDQFEIDEFYHQLVDIAIKDPSFAIYFLPDILRYIIKSGKNPNSKQQLSMVFETGLQKGKDVVSVLVRVFQELVEGTEYLLPMDPQSLATSCVRVNEPLNGLIFVEKHWIETGTRLSSILLDCYQGMQDRDSFEGAISLLNPQEFDFNLLATQYCAHNQQWTQVMRRQEVLMQLDKTSSDYLIQSLSNSFHYSIVDQLGSQDYNSLWRLSKWDDLSGTPTDGDHSIYKALSRLDHGGSELLESVQVLETNDLMHTLSLYCISDAQKVKLKQMDLTRMLQEWHHRLQEIEQIQGFKKTEMLLSVYRTVLLLLMNGQEHLEDQIPVLQQHLSQHLLNYVSSALLDHQELPARMGVGFFDRYCSQVDKSLVLKNKLFQYRIEWAFGSKNIAFKYLKHLTSNCNPVYAESIFYCAQFAQQSKQESTNDILLYYKECISNAKEDTGKYHYEFAKFCDSVLMDQQQTLLSEAKLREKETEYVQLSKLERKESLEIRLKWMKREIEFERREIDKQIQENAQLLVQSVENYLKSLMYWDQHQEEMMLRVCALWFSVSNQEVNQLLIDYCDKIMPQKFLVIGYQISARIAALSKEDVFYESLFSCLNHMVSHFPYHCLNYLLALNNGSESKNASNVLKRLGAKKELWNVIVKMDRMFKGYIELAKQEHMQRKGKIASKNKLLVMQDEKLPLITADHQMLQSNWDHVYMTSISTEYKMVGGINAPKLIQMMGSDGKVYKQLVKAKDDLRQDCVLSSVFSIIKVLLLKHFETRSRKLSLRNYKVVPMAPQVGVVELQPNDWKYRDCRQFMEKEQKNDASSKLEAFRTVLKHFKPVLGKLFFEMYPNGREWYQRRNQYVKSVATVSVVGQILGIGDRHAQNLLFDRNTGEMIHIDLGIAFDQGRLLSVPELVPFRLTQNMVHGMGVTKTEGLFKRSCQETLAVLKQDAHILFTLLNVFRYDPLYTWTVSQPLKRKNSLDNQPSQGAERALLNVQRKLNSPMSTECQISEWINEATDDHLLSRMFYGWGAWL
ncbi:hypothetical protein EDD86DRAFT_254912 [Gorgonomyces haynaldii]|nr:hypothetical protein EDD86DRAFT_254912 [Gorgonomyces haynaldii]